MILDTLVAIALLGGALLAALGGIGLLRFPDVFTRMHAATKAATVGVIGTTTAAAVEAGAPPGVLLLILVIALLFLTSPLGMSALARASYHDPETPRFPGTIVVDAPPDEPQPTHPAPVGGASPLLGLWLFVAWVALFGAPRPNVLLGGIAVAAALTLAVWRPSRRRPRGLLSARGALRFVVQFSRQLVVSTWDLVRMLFIPHRELRPAVVALPLRVATRFELTLLMNAISFTPGSVALEVHDDRVFIHALATKNLDAVLADLDALQSSVIGMVRPTRSNVTGNTQSGA